MKKNIKLCVFDLDGTLLNSNSLLSTENIKTCTKWQKENKIITIATGRAFENSVNFVKELSLDKNAGFLISNNGAQIYDFKKEKFIFSAPFNKEEYLKIWEYLSSFPTIFLFFFDGHNQIMYHNKVSKYDEEINLHINYHCFSPYHMSPKMINKADLEKLSIPFFKLLVIFNNEEQIKSFKSWLNENNINLELFIMSNNLVFEITTTNVNKGNAVLKLCKYLNLKNDEVLVAGDNGNDVSMFQIFKNSFTTANYNPVVLPYVKTIFKKTNDHHIAKMIDESI
ncbi:HAD family hydrolase [Mycoplasma sp. SG1]|uniref:HAD family hydrolase n=1 Tax=Mycoplasma sp. SG1 TaxID=2810348 RepID=UPI002023D325|nr:HAD family hydrolase [Mycoplasma sp. SG1]URM52761.1 HAD family hydrolase [Mycoplasma sp. SG1]